MECFKRFIQSFVFKLISTVCMENLYFFQINIDSGKSSAHQNGIFVLASPLTDDFPVEQINKHTDVIPVVSCPYIGQIADYNIILGLIREIPVYYVLSFGFIAFIHMRFVLCYGIGGYKPLLFHDPPNASMGNPEVFFGKLHFDFPGTIIIPALPEYLPDFICQTIFWLFLRCFIIRTSRDV